jgi:signal transduction histidine kinase
MSLQRKFAVLLTVLAVMAVVNVGSALWTINFLEETSAPWTSIQQVLDALSQIKRDAAGQASLWTARFPMGGPDDEPMPAEPEPAARYDADAHNIAAAMQTLGSLDEFRIRVGASTSDNLRQKVREADAAGRAWLAAAPGTPQRDAARREASAAFFRLHELIERIERQVVNGAYDALDFSRGIRPWLLVVLGASVLGMALAGALGVVLVRRWVVRPVGVLRGAADRLAKGDFAHRVPEMGKDELGLLSAEINHMAGMISTMQEERVERERLAAVGEVVRRIVHNLRNPLAGIRSLAELSRAELPAESAARESQDRIVSTVDRFERWLKELLSATAPLQLEAAPHPVRPWLLRTVDPLRPMAAARNVALDIDLERAPERATFDPRHLEHALVGIVTNGIQASPAGQAVTIRSSVCQDGQTWEIRVSDRGPGVPAELVDKVFRPYFTTKRDGNGIGLAVAKQVVEQHGGRVWVEPSENETQNESGQGDTGPGAVFVVRIPLASIGQRSPELARPGQIGARGGQDSHGRGRSEPPVLHPADAQARRT